LRFIIFVANRCFAKGATMYEFLGALAFSALVAGYVLAVIFIRHRDSEQPGTRKPSHLDGV
jgi:hypothetical protein